MESINEKSMCCGCYACSNICPENAITMKEDEEGFAYPNIDEKKCIKCNLCKKVCPVLNKKQITNNPNAYACINKNEQIRKESSSGGIFTLIAEEILKQGGVVFGARYSNNFEVIHSFVEREEELKLFRESKYVQSKIGDCYKKAKEFLENNRYVLFTGTPCQIEGLYSYLQKDYNKLYTQDISCHGVPSPMIWRKYKESIENKYNSQIDNINFRDKTKGWNRYLVSYTLKNGKKHGDYNLKNRYMRAFLEDLSNRKSCNNCQFKGINRKADITLADFWGINHVLPKMNDNRGTSLVIINSEKGEYIFEKIKENIRYEKVKIEDAVKYNPSMVISAKQNPKRKEFFEKVKNSSFDNAAQDCIQRESITKKIFQKLKFIIRH